jgi:hypothetical protein
VGDDLVAEREYGILVALLVFVNMDRRDLKRIVVFRGNFIAGDRFEVSLDMNHQHVEME